MTLGFIAADGHIPERQKTGIHDDTAAIPRVVTAGDGPAAGTIGKGQITVCGDHIAVCHSGSVRKAAVDVVAVQVDCCAGMDRQRSVGRTRRRISRQGDGGRSLVQFMLHPLPDGQELRVKRHVPAHGIGGKVPFVLECRFFVPAFHIEPVLRTQRRFRDIYAAAEDLIGRCCNAGTADVKAHRIGFGQCCLSRAGQSDRVIFIIAEEIAVIPIARKPGGEDTRGTHMDPD